ncbi:MAG: DUF4390 domain-containing protein [Gammaproteobacteria bacterium]|nr:MAG: DUF4390 domain-containing protein [Gammaproteobacteria bacterium]
MPGTRSPWTLRPPPSFLWALWVLTLLPGLFTGARADEPGRPGFRVVDVRSERSDGLYRVDANLHLRLSRAAREALDNGLPLTIQIRMQVLRPRRYLWDEVVAEVIQRYRLRYHALARRYVLVNLNTDEQRPYPTLAQALARLGTLRDFPLIDTHLLDPEATYLARIRVELDIESLPTPMRVMAYLSKAWHLDSDWYVWRLQG